MSQLLHKAREYKRNVEDWTFMDKVNTDELGKFLDEVITILEQAYFQQLQNASDGSDSPKQPDQRTMTLAIMAAILRGRNAMVDQALREAIAILNEAENWTK